MPDPIHPATPQQDSPHTLGNRIGRAAWGLFWLLLFRPSPRFLHRYRNLCLRLWGARLAGTARVYPSARIWAPWNLTMGEHASIDDFTDIYNAAAVTIGPRSTVSRYSFLCTASHDFEKPDQPLVTAPIGLGENVWLAADVFVGPEVRIADGVVVGARSSVFASLDQAWTVYAGSPARAVRARRLGEENRPASA